MLKTLIQTQRRTLATYTKLASNNQIYVHPLSPTSLQLSFSKTLNNHPLGTVSSSSSTSSSSINPVPSNFQKDKTFLPFLNKIIKDTVHEDFTYNIQSYEFKNEYMPIYDLRNPPNYQRIPLIEDCFGFVWVDSNGEIQKDSFQVNDLYSIVSVDGCLKLSDHLYEKVMEQVKE